MLLCWVRGSFSVTQFLSTSYFSSQPPSQYRPIHYYRLASPPSPAIHCIL